MDEAYAVGWLVGEGAPVTLGDLVGRARGGTFFWLDITGERWRAQRRVPERRVVAWIRGRPEAPGSAGVLRGCRVVRPGHAAMDRGTGPTASLDTIYVGFLLDEKYLLTVHETPCEPLSTSGSIRGLGRDDESRRAAAPSSRRSMS